MTPEDQAPEFADKSAEAAVPAEIPAPNTVAASAPAKKDAPAASAIVEGDFAPAASDAAAEPEAVTAPEAKSAAKTAVKSAVKAAGTKRQFMREPSELDFELDHHAPKVVLLTTTSGDEDAVANLERMLKGLRQQAEGGANLCSIILVQKDEAETETLKARLDPPPFVEMIPCGGRMSLSAARNVMLGYAAEAGLIASDDVVAFPDDDSWYRPGFLTKIQYLFTSDPFFDFFFCRYGSAPVACHLSRCKDAPSAQTVITNASSNTIFVRGRLANLIGGFDEELGVGAKYKSGEDLDYALRAFFHADQRAYLDAAVVGHRDKNPAIRAKYFRGSLLVLSRYAATSMAMAVALLRKLAVGALLVATFRLGAGEYCGSIRTAIGALGRGERNE